MPHDRLDYGSAIGELIYNAIAGRIEHSLISGPIVFTVVGFILGADGLSILPLHIDCDRLRRLAELTLAMALFTDAANADFSRRQQGGPSTSLEVATI